MRLHVRRCVSYARDVYKRQRIGTVIVPTVWSSIVNFFAMFAIIPFFVGIYCLIRLLEMCIRDRPSSMVGATAI